MSDLTFVFQVMCVIALWLYMLKFLRYFFDCARYKKDRDTRIVSAKILAALIVLLFSFSVVLLCPSR
jgi:hypothetical protein